MNFFLLLLLFFPIHSCSATCPLALASYFISPNQTLSIIGSRFNIDFGQLQSRILPYNKQIRSQDSINAGTRVNIPFPCDQTNNSFLSHSFTYLISNEDTYDTIATSKYANLTTTESLTLVNSYQPTRIPTGVSINVSVNCSCGNEDVSPDYGLFLTYPVRNGEDINSIAKGTNFTGNLDLLRRFNPGSNFQSGIVFVPARDQNGNYPPFPTSSNKEISGGAIAGIIIGVIIVLLGICTYLYFGVYKKRKAKKSQLISSSLEENSILRSDVAMHELSSEERNASIARGFMVDKSVEFSYEELAKATNDFSMAHKIGEGGFGAVYYAELRGEKAAIKKMDMEATREFLAELKVLTNVHHLNLVRLIGYCTESSLFLVYEFIENGNLSQHLRGSDREPLEWPTRVQIALDSARGLEYIHEHTVPVYIHRDIKPANILLNKEFHAKVADFGLTKLTEVGGMTQPTRLVGTFGYMPPEYAQFGDVSPKIDVYAFGVVLYELISAKEAVVRAGPGTESMGLVAMFEEALNKPDPSEHLKQLVDPRLGNSYPIDSVHKVALLAKACTHENPQLRPSMRTIVVALMTLSSNTEDWDVASFYGNQAMLNLMSGR